MKKNSNRVQVTDENAQQLTAYLEDLLARQIARLKQYDIDGAMELGEESEQLSQTIARSGVLRRPEFTEQSDRIEDLYRELCLQIASQRQEVSDKLEQIRTGIRTLGAYAGK